MTHDEESKLLTGMAVLQTMMAEVHGQVEKIDLTIHGNGKPGLKATVAAHETTLKNVKRIGWLLAAPVLWAAGTGMVSAAIYLIHMVK